MTGRFAGPGGPGSRGERYVSSAAPEAERIRARRTRYRGGGGMWAWVAQRITGVLVFFFLFAHILDVALVRVSPNAYDTVMDLYKNPLAAVLEVVLVAAVLYHAVNGLRVIAVDFWSKGARYQRQLLWAALAVWFVIMLPVAFIMLSYSASSLFGGT
jgi:succinate dehydrogenase / fumarate reductase cytochrome b subunit